MLDIIVNKNKNKNNLKVKRRKKLKRPKVFKETLEAFRPTVENQLYLDKLYNKSAFINRAIALYINYIHKPKIILKELKSMRPILYKQIGRRKF